MNTILVKISTCFLKIMVPVSLYQDGLPLLVGWESVADIAACYEAGSLGIQSQWWQDFLYLSSKALGPTSLLLKR